MSWNVTGTFLYKRPPSRRSERVLIPWHGVAGLRVVGLRTTTHGENRNRKRFVEGVAALFLEDQDDTVADLVQLLFLHAHEFLGVEARHDVNRRPVSVASVRIVRDEGHGRRVERHVETLVIELLDPSPDFLLRLILSFSEAGNVDDRHRTLLLAVARITISQFLKKSLQP